MLLPIPQRHDACLVNKTTAVMAALTAMPLFPPRSRVGCKALSPFLQQEAMGIVLLSILL